MAQKGYFILADISGYTEFLTKSELDHAQDALQNQFDAQIAHIKYPFVDGFLLCGRGGAGGCRAKSRHRLSAWAEKMPGLMSIPKRKLGHWGYIHQRADGSFGEDQ